MTHRTPERDQLDACCQQQAREFLGMMRAGGHLPPPAHLPTLSAAQLAPSLNTLGDTLTGQALAWEKLAPSAPAVRHYSNGLLYCGLMLAQLHRLAPDPLHALTAFSTWAASFMRDVLTENGYSEGEAVRAVDDLDSGPAQLLAALGRLPDDRARGAFMAAYSSSHAGPHALTVSGSPEALGAYFTAAGVALGATGTPLGGGLQA